jgi:bacterial/archaeal transporter family-2 protein
VRLPGISGGLHELASDGSLPPASTPARGTRSIDTPGPLLESWPGGISYETASEMQSVSVFWLFPFIAVAGALQAVGVPMNAVLRTSLVNPWLAALVSFGLIVAVFIVITAVFPRPLPTAEAISAMPWWAPLGGIVGAFAVVAGLLFVDRIGAGPFAAFTVSANLITSVVIDHFGWLHVPQHAITPARAAGAVLLIAGIALMTLF